MTPGDTFQLNVGGLGGYATGGLERRRQPHVRRRWRSSDIRADACDKLAAFMAQVTAQRGKKIPEAMLTG